MLRVKNYLDITKLLNASLRTSVHQNCCCSTKSAEIRQQNEKYVTVFAFPFIKYLAVFNRLKVYHMLGSAAVISICGPLEAVQILESGSTAVAIYIGITGAILLSLSSLMTKGVIGFIYVSEDDSTIKISYLDYWGKRNNFAIDFRDWTPLSELPQKPLNLIYTTPIIEGDKRKLKLFTRFGNVLDMKKMNAVIE